MIVRKTAESDLDGIRDLYGEEKRNSSTIRRDDNHPWEWLLTDNDKVNSFRSFVAVDDDIVIGHIGYVRSYYNLSGKSYVGVHPITWNMDEKHRGLLGLKLLFQVMRECDFNIIIGGTEIAQNIYRSLNFKLVTYGKKFTKILSPTKYYKIINGSPLVRIAKTLYHLRAILKMRRLSSSNRPEITVEMVEEIHKFNYEIAHSVMANIPDEKHIDWILSCPEVKTYAFSISTDKGARGFAVCYTQRTANDILVGRIVHISNLGSDFKLWHQAIFKLEKFLKTKGCAIISTLATYPVFIQALYQSGYLFRAESPVWIKGDAATIPLDSIHLTYLEGDLGYRGLF